MIYHLGNQRSDMLPCIPCYINDEHKAKTCNGIENFVVNIGWYNIKYHQNGQEKQITVCHNRKSLFPLNWL